MVVVGVVIVCVLLSLLLPLDECFRLPYINATISKQGNILTDNKFSAAAIAVCDAGLANLCIKKGIKSGGSNARESAGACILYGASEISGKDRCKLYMAKTGVQPIELCSDLLYAKIQHWAGDPMNESRCTRRCEQMCTNQG